MRQKRHERRVYPEPPREYYVYVIEASAKGRRIFYVGQSGKTPEARARDHGDYLAQDVNPAQALIVATPRGTVAASACRTQQSTGGSKVVVTEVNGVPTDGVDFDVILFRIPNLGFVLPGGTPAHAAGLVNVYIYDQVHIDLHNEFHGNRLYQGYTYV